MCVPVSGRSKVEKCYPEFPPEFPNSWELEGFLILIQRDFQCLLYSLIPWSVQTPIPPLQPTLTVLHLA